MIWVAARTIRSAAPKLATWALEAKSPSSTTFALVYNVIPPTAAKSTQVLLSSSAESLGPLGHRQVTRRYIRALTITPQHTVAAAYIARIVQPPPCPLTSTNVSPA